MVEQQVFFSELAKVVTQLLYFLLHVVEHILLMITQNSTDLPFNIVFENYKKYEQSLAQIVSTVKPVKNGHSKIKT